MSDPIDDAEMNDPELSGAGPNSFEARARKASESVRQQLAAGEPGDELGLRRTRRPIRRRALPRIAAAAVLVAGVAVLGPRLVGGDGSGSAGLGGAGVAYAAGPLKAFADCDAVLGYFKEHAAGLSDRTGEQGVGGSAPRTAADVPGRSRQRAADSHRRRGGWPRRRIIRPPMSPKPASTNPTWSRPTGRSSSPSPAVGCT